LLVQLLIQTYFLAFVVLFKNLCPFQPIIGPYYFDVCGIVSNSCSF
jgi:hypothetical protein